MIEAAAVTKTFQMRFAAAYGPLGAIDWQQIITLITSLLSGCTGAQVKARAVRRPVLLQLMLEVRATEIWDDPTIGINLAKATMTTLAQSSAEEIDAFKIAPIPAAV